MGITFGDYLIDCGYHDITSEQEREIEAREECKRRGLDPDDYAADGVTVWMVIDKELFDAVPTPEPERRCQKCGCPTRGEEALVDWQTWCHPCADSEKNR